MGTVGYADPFAFSGLIRLAPAECDDCSVSRELHVFEEEADEFRTAECSGESQEEKRSIPEAGESRREGLNHELDDVSYGRRLPRLR